MACLMLGTALTRHSLNAAEIHSFSVAFENVVILYRTLEEFYLADRRSVLEHMSGGQSKIMTICSLFLPCSKFLSGLSAEKLVCVSSVVLFPF